MAFTADFAWFAQRGNADGMRSQGQIADLNIASEIQDVAPPFILIVDDDGCPAIIFVTPELDTDR